MSDAQKASGFVTLWEWAKGSPMKREGLERLNELDRLRLAEILSNGELSESEKKLCLAYRSPLDMAKWALAGVEGWGLDEATAPMRAWARAERLRSLLSGGVGSAYAANDWATDANGERRESSAASRAAPSNAFTLMFKRRALPGLAGAAILAKGWASFPLLGVALSCAAKGQTGLALASGGIAAFAKFVESALSSHGGNSARIELKAMRSAMASKARVEKLARLALSQAREMGYAAAKGVDFAQLAQESETGKKNEAEARALSKKADELSRGHPLEVLDRADEILALREKADELKTAANRSRKRKLRARGPSFEEACQELGVFQCSVTIQNIAAKANSVSALKERELALRARRELESAVPEAPKVSPTAPRRANRM